LQAGFEGQAEIFSECRYAISTACTACVWAADRPFAQAFGGGKSQIQGQAFQSAMSMLNFHINRGGRGLTAKRRRVLNQAKVELRKLFDL
jgi:hypothetical protein